MRGNRGQEERTLRFLKKELRHVSSPGKPRQDPNARYHSTSTKSSASKSCQTSSEDCRYASIASINGSAKPNLPANDRRFSAKLSAVSRGVVQDASNDDKYNRGRRTKVGGAQAGYEVHKSSPPIFSGPVLPTGCG